MTTKIASFLSAAAVAATMALGTQAAKAGVQDFHFTNDTGYTIVRLYVSPTYTRSWEENLLNGKLYNGRRTFVRINGYRKCYFDIRAVDSEGDVYVQRGVNLCRYSVRFTFAHLNRV